MDDASVLSAFVGSALLIEGPPAVVLARCKEVFDEDPGAALLIFEEESGRQVDFDLRGPLALVLSQLPPGGRPKGPGRPRLGVISREVSLLPRHWEWLEQQPQGASAALRRLVEEARRQAPDKARRARDAAASFMTAMAGNLPGYEEATRALYANDPDRVRALIAPWPPGIQGRIARWLDALCAPLAPPHV